MPLTHAWLRRLTVITHFPKKNTSLFSQQGQLAPAESVIEVFCSLKEEFANGFILDGFPRSAEQVSLFEAAIRREPTLSPHFALHLSLRRDLSVAKLLGRRECSVCHANWNVADIHEVCKNTPTHSPPPLILTSGEKVPSGFFPQSAALGVMIRAYPTGTAACRVCTIKFTRVKREVFIDGFKVFLVKASAADAVR